MKKSILLLFPLLFMLSCVGTNKTVSVNRLKMGMTKADVEYMFGPPERILVVFMTDFGYQEVLAYKTYKNEVYALEFVDDRLVGYEFLHEAVEYTPRPITQPVVIHNYIQPSSPPAPNRKPAAKPTPAPKPSAPTRVTSSPASSGRTEQNNTPTRITSSPASSVRNEQNNTPTRIITQSQRTSVTTQERQNESSRTDNSGGANESSRNTTSREQNQSSSRR